MSNIYQIGKYELGENVFVEWNGSVYEGVIIDWYTSALYRVELTLDDGSKKMINANVSTITRNA